MYVLLLTWTTDLIYLQKSWNLCAQNAFFFTFSVKHLDKKSESQFEASSTYAKMQRVAKNS